MRSASKAPNSAPADPPPDARAIRRAARRAENRADLLDAAEEVFGEHGVSDGSLRQIAQRAGFSPAAIYLFFDNKQDLLSETLVRRGAELVATLRDAALAELPPIVRLHHMVDVAVAFFEARPHFRRLLGHVNGGTAIVGPALAHYTSDVGGYFTEAMAIVAGIIRDGQAAGEVRDGDPVALGRLYSALINEHVLLGGGGQADGRALTTAQFHGLIDGALRNPRR